MANDLTDLTGQEVAHYHIERRIGGGVLAGVYEATDQILEKPVALKVLLVSADDLTRQRFRQEARTGSSLEHPHIVQTLQVGQTASDGIAYIAMELVRGLTLSELLDKHPLLSVADASNVLEPVSQALNYAHEKGIVHRDVKPSNILLRHVPSGTPNSVQLSVGDSAVVPLLSDFGISRALDSPNLTNAGRAIGTPSYMAPEQCAGSREIDGRADIYSLGTVLYRCLVGRAPYIGTTTQILHAHVYEPLTIPDDILDTLPDSIIDILKRSLAKEPESRYQNVGNMARDLAQTTSKITLPIRSYVDEPAEGESQVDDAPVVVDDSISTGEETAKSVDAPVADAPVAAIPISKLPTEQITPTKLPRVVPPIKRTSTSHPRVTRPLPPHPVPAARRERNWAGFVIGGVLMLVILFAGLAAFRSIWPANPDFSTTTTTTTTATTENSGENSGDDSTEISAENSADNDSENASGDSTDAPADASADTQPEITTGDSDSGSADEGDENVDADTDAETDAERSQSDSIEEASLEELEELSVELAGHWEDVQFFHAQRNWQDAADSLTLMQKIDSNFESEELESIRFNIYMGLASAQMQKMLASSRTGTDDDASVWDRQQLALAAGYYSDALDVEPDSTAASDLRDSLDQIAESVSTASQESISGEEISVLRDDYASFSASLALQGNYCSAVEQLGVAVLLDNIVLQQDNEKQEEQLASYIEICDEPTDILSIIEDKRRARQIVGAADSPASGDTGAVAASDIPPATAVAEVISDPRAASAAPTETPTVRAAVPTARPTARPTTRPTAQPTRRSTPATVSRSALTGSILYSSFDEGVSKIWSVSVAPNAESTQIVQSARQPTMHPNGQLVTYHSDQGFKEGVRGFDLQGTMTLPEGSYIQFIYHPEASQYSPPTWSPAGDKMLFGSTVDADRVARIYYALNNNKGDYLYVAHGREPDWHPFDDLIVYKGADDTGNRPGLWLMNSNGGSRERFSDNAGDSRPVWSTNGTHIVFMSNDRSGSWDIFSANYETRAVQQLTTNPANDGLPTVSPDGKYVAFLSNRNGIWQIWAVPIDGGTPQLLTPIRGALPNWLEQAIHWIQ